MSSFARDFSGQKTHKNSDVVTYPDNLSLTYLEGEQQGQAQYELYAVVYHHGAFEGGHYTAKVIDEWSDNGKYDRPQPLSTQLDYTAHLSSPLLPSFNSDHVNTYQLLELN